METIEHSKPQRGRRVPARDRRETPEMLAEAAAQAAYRAARERVVWRGAAGDGVVYQVEDRVFAPLHAMESGFDVARRAEHAATCRAFATGGEIVITGVRDVQAQ